MKGLFVGLLVFCGLFLGANLHSQVSTENLHIVSQKLELKRPDFSYYPQSVPFIFNPLNTNQSSSLGIFSSPIKYTAFFCKMEYKTVKKIGVWVKIHAGDYDAYSGSGCWAARQ